jgi:RNA polymerase sigma-70 factor, ECF subfamily
MQDTFIKVFIKIDTLNKVANIKAWLYKIAQNHAIDYLRKQNKLNYYMQALKNNAILQRHPDFSNDNNIDFARLLGKLKPIYKQVIILRRLIGYSTDETGRELNWSDSKVKTTLNRATYQLKNWISNI